jgi:hypothetical protein
MRSSGGQLIFVNDSIFTAECRNQTLITDSSAYAETYEVARTTKLLIAVTNIFRELDLYQDSSAIPIYVDNKACRELSVKSNLSKRSRHFELHATFFKQYIGALIELKPVGTDDNPADIMTKSLGTKAFLKHRDMFMTSKDNMEFTDS